MRQQLTWTLGALLASLPLTAQTDARSLRAVRINTPIHLDGHLDEPAWAQAPEAGDFIMQWPNFGHQPTLPTTVKVLYDDRYVYIGARMSHPKNHAKVIKRLHRRDQDSSSDWFTVYLDTLHDRRTAWRPRLSCLRHHGYAPRHGGAGHAGSADP